MPTARGWREGREAGGGAGLEVNAFARGLRHPRWIEAMPNGDVLVAEALFEPAPTRTSSITPWSSTMRRAAAVGVSPNRIILLRDARQGRRGGGPEVFLDGLNQPFGMALVGDTSTSATPTAWSPFLTPREQPASPHRGASSTTSSPAATGRGACWQARTSAKLYAGVGSLSNIGENGWIPRRAAPRSTKSI